MRVLLDTCTFLWALVDAPELSATARGLFLDPSNEVFLSAASAWEISVKHSLGRLPLPGPPEVVVPEQRKKHAILPLPIDEESALNLGKLPSLHRDPFDRMLVSQALVHALVLLTPDREIRQYPVRTAW